MTPRRLSALAATAMLAIATARAAPSAVAFDALFRRIDDGEVQLVDPAQAARVLRELQLRLPAGDARRARRHRSLVCSVAFREDSKGALECARQGADEARRARDVEAQARFIYARGFALELQDAAGAAAAYTEGLGFARRAEDARLIGDGLVYRGSVRSLQGDQARALQDLLEAQAIFDRARLARRSESNLLNIGIAYRRMGFYDEALPYLRDSEAFARRVGHRVDEIGALMQIGYAYEELHQAAPSIAAFERALALAEQSDRYDRGYAHLGLAQARLVAGDAAGALDEVARSRRELDVDGAAEHEPMLAHVEGVALARLGRHRAAIAAFDRAEPLMREQANLRYLALVWQARAASREALGDARAALRDLQAYAKASTRLRAEADDQRVTLWRMHFDRDRRALERARLDLDRRRREQEIRALRRERPWRVLVLALGTALAAALAALALLQRREARRLRVLVLSDPLTGLDNRRQILQLARAALNDARRSGAPLSVVALDLDHFKRINDRHGHATGDAVLAASARAFTAALRRGDRLGRSGGEEFLAVLPATPAEAAAEVAERLRTALGTLGGELQVRTSAGVATAGPAEGLDALLRRADAALYAAKAGGRDRVIVAD